MTQTHIIKPRPTSLAINDEIALELQLLREAEPLEHQRDKNGRWMGPYFRVNQTLLPDQPSIALNGGGETRRTSIAAIFPSNKPHSLVVELDWEEMQKVMRADDGGYYGVGHKTNGMTMEAVGKLSMALMAASHNKQGWWRVGTLTNQRGEDERVVMQIKPGVRLPRPNERGRIRLIARNYLGIQRDREIEEATRNLM